MDASSTTRPGAWPWSIALVLLALLAQLPLILNPGYYSHDELQWAAYASAASAHTVEWLDFNAFQYRPLTFNLWLWLSRHLFAHPYAFHAVVVGWGTVNALLLQRLLLKTGVAGGTATTAALVFALSPYAVSVHGWVGTIADLAWLGCALSIALLGLHVRGWTARLVAAFVLTAVALLAKESALAIPALVAVACWADRRRGEWVATLWGATAAALLYLGLRYGPLLSAPAPSDAYDWRLAHVPMRWLEFQLFPPNVGVAEAFNTVAGDFTRTRVLAAAVLWLGLLAALWRIGWRWALAFVAGGVAALGPVLVLGTAYNQYGYALAAFGCGLFALAWPRLHRWGKPLVILYAVLMLWHGANGMRLMHHVGTVQARFSPALAAAIGPATAAAPLRLRLAPGSEDWIFKRLTHEIPSYRGVAIGDRVQIVDGGEAADYLVEPDGRLTPLHGPPH